MKRPLYFFVSIATVRGKRNSVGTSVAKSLEGGPVPGGYGVLFDFRLTGSLAGQAIALLGGVFAGLAMTLIQKLRRDNDSVVIYLYFCTMCAIVAAPKFIMDPTFPDTVVEVALILGIILSSLFAQLLMNQGFLYCRGWEGGVFMSSEVVFTAIVGISFLGDPASWRFWLGGLLVLGSVTLLNRLRAAQKNGVDETEVEVDMEGEVDVPVVLTVAEVRVDAARDIGRR